MNEQLVLEHQRVRQAWRQYVQRGEKPQIRTALLASWARSARTVQPERILTRVDEPVTWQDSALEFATRALRPELQTFAQEGDLMIALADARGQLLWTAGSQRMTSAARAVNFVPGAWWDEASAGTNALALALQERQAVRVFAAEHFAQAVHDWVCYSAPIHDGGGQLLGVLNFSSTWEHCTPLGLGSVQFYAGQISDRLRPTVQPGLQVNLCGPPSVQLLGQPLHLTPRQLELLAVLALSPDGLTLDALHAQVYGDQPISMSTLKSEVSTLRALLGGQISSRPYRLSLPLELDMLQIEVQLNSGQLARALELYHGSPLPLSQSPLLTYWREYLDGALRSAVETSGDTELLWNYASRFDAPEVLERLQALLPVGHFRLPLVRARLAALGWGA